MMIQNGKTIKVVFAGPTNVGKSSIIEKYCYNRITNTTSTIGAAFFHKTIKRDDKIVTLGIWDTAGQERYHSLSSIYFRGALYCILVFDLSSNSSFQHIDRWLQLCNEANNNQPFAPVYFLVGNKLDKPRNVSIDDIEQYCRSHNIECYIETSAHTGDGISLLYDKIFDHICSRGNIPDIISQVSLPPPEKLDNRSVCSC